jgi:hypothetical protein
MVRLVLDKVYSCLRSWPRLRFCFVSYFFIILLDRVSDAKRILILGEGDGRVLARLLTIATSAQIDVVEVSPEMIALARQLRRSPDYVLSGLLHRARGRPLQTWIRTMYFFFGITTGLETQALPPIRKLLSEAGMQPVESQHTRAGLITSEVYASVPAPIHCSN